MGTSQDYPQENLKSNSHSLNQCHSPLEKCPVRSQHRIARHRPSSKEIGLGNSYQGKTSMPLALSEPQVVIPTRFYRLTQLDSRGRGGMSPRISSPDLAENVVSNPSRIFRFGKKFILARVPVSELVVSSMLRG